MHPALSLNYNNLNINYFLNQYPYFTNQGFILPEIRRNPFFKILGFPNVQYFPVLIIILIHPGTVGQFADYVLDMDGML